VIVQKLTRNVNEGHVKEIFGNYGLVKEVLMPMNRQGTYRAKRVDLATSLRGLFKPSETRGTARSRATFVETRPKSPRSVSRAKLDYASPRAQARITYRNTRMSHRTVLAPRSGLLPAELARRDSSFLLIRSREMSHPTLSV
jgi:hypothetical protein